jgi:hypothetical protein
MLELNKLEAFSVNGRGVGPMRKKNYLRVLITVLVVILGISGIGWFTWHLGKIFIGLVSAAESGRTQEAPSGSVILDLPQISFWTCQVGIYNDRKNADLLLENLKDKGWKAGMIKEDPYTVAIGVYNTKEEAVAQGEIILQDGMEVWVRKETYPALSYKVKGKNIERATFILQTANSLIGGKSIKEIKAELAGDKDVFLNADFPADFQKLQSTLVDIFDTEYLETESKNLYCQDLLGLFQEYRLITTKFLKNYDN